MMVEAVARELCPKVMRLVKCLSWGGLLGSWVVARRTHTWRETDLGLERTVVLLRETLSLITPRISLKFIVSFPLADEFV